MTKRFRILIFGRVQGVFFRASAQHEAQKLDLTGFIENRPDGSVYIEAEGKKKQLDSFLKWCQKGPPLAEVVRIEVEEAPLKNTSIFAVR